MSTIFGISGIGLQLLSTLGNVKQESSVKKFHEDLRVLLETKRGTLIGDPNFGSNLCDLLYEPANTMTANQIRQEIATTIEKYYNNVNITQVDVTYKPHTVQLGIYYRLFNSNINDTVMLEFIRGDIN